MREQPRILFLLPFAPRSDARQGGAKVMAGLISRLAADHPSALVYLRAAGEDPLDDSLRAQCDVVEEVARPLRGTSGAALWKRRAQAAWGLGRGVPRWAEEWSVAEYASRVRHVAASWRPDLVHVHYTVMGVYLPALAGSSAPRVLVVHEPGAERAADEYRGAPRLSKRLDAAAWRRFERRVVGDASAAVVFTRRDRVATDRLGTGTPTYVIPFGVPVSELPPPDESDGETVVFVGSFDHRPNVAAAIALARDIFPRVRAARPSARLQIIGTSPPDELRSLAGERVEVTGAVPDVAPYLERAAVYAAPLRVGGGMRVKVAEALAAGKAVVATSLAVEGLDVTDGQELVVAETDEQIAEATSALLADPGRRHALESRAHAWAVEHLGWERPIEAYRELHAELLAPASAAPPQADHADVSE
jgi:glycosyltransferase involved in cell wall biosynthesis